MPALPGKRSCIGPGGSHALIFSMLFTAGLQLRVPITDVHVCFCILFEHQLETSKCDDEGCLLPVQQDRVHYK